MANIKKAKISDLKHDERNFNKGTEIGKSLIKKSLKKFGVGRSILLDKNNNIIAGNKTTENYNEGGGENVIIVETDGDTLIAVKRLDIDINSKKGREMALADNATAKANIVWDAEVLEAEMEEAVCEEWGVKTNSIDFDDIEGNQDRTNAKASKEVTCPNCSCNFQV